MSRLNSVTNATAGPEVGRMLDAIRSRYGMVPKIYEGVANSAAALEGILALSDALSRGSLAPDDREAVYLAVSQRNGCRYCLAAHSALARQLGMSDDELLAARRFRSSSKPRQALLAFVEQVCETRGFLSDTDLEQVRGCGYSDGEIVEAIAYVALATFTNFFNHVHDTPIDFPPVPEVA